MIFIYYILQFYIHTQQNFKCIEVQKSDRLGVYTSLTPAAVGFNFVTSSSGTVFQHTFASDPIPSSTETLFDRLAFPYELSAAAYIHTGN